MIYKHPGPLLASSHLYFNLTETSVPCRFSKQWLVLLIGFSVSMYYALSAVVRPPVMPLFHNHSHAWVWSGAWYMCGCPENHYGSVRKKHWNQLSIYVWVVSHQSFNSPHSSKCLIHYRSFISSTSLSPSSVKGGGSDKIAHCRFSLQLGWNGIQGALTSIL